ncbi:Golgi resident protein GCP60 [Merluccius polli]|uniref:Golgi resident protein GCP60 n=1 Tax=Merluccius polli TaxID=89951 RepID=A0AA47MPW2_MERPO|nr:Golgi resident protein GCP60 [Merluccius polli]
MVNGGQSDSYSESMEREAEAEAAEEVSENGPLLAADSAPVIAAPSMWTRAADQGLQGEDPAGRRQRDHGGPRRGGWTDAASASVSVHVSESSDEDEDDEARALWRGGEGQEGGGGSPRWMRSVPVYRRDCHEEVYAGSHQYPGPRRLPAQVRQLPTPCGAPRAFYYRAAGRETSPRLRLLEHDDDGGGRAARYRHRPASLFCPLDEVSCSTMVNLIRQLSDLCRHATDVFAGVEAEGGARRCGGARAVRGRLDTLRERVARFEPKKVQILPLPDLMIHARKDNDSASIPVERKYYSILNMTQ